MNRQIKSEIDRGITAGSCENMGIHGLSSACVISGIESSTITLNKTLYDDQGQWEWRAHQDPLEEWEPRQWNGAIQVRRVSDNIFPRPDKQAAGIQKRPIAAEIYARFMGEYIILLWEYAQGRWDRRSILGRKRQGEERDGEEWAETETER